jgi:hypothetical protein
LILYEDARKVGFCTDFVPPIWLSRLFTILGNTEDLQITWIQRIGPISTDFAERRSYRVDRMQSATVTSQVFTPRYAVESDFDGTVSRRTIDCNTARAKHAAGVKAFPVFCSCLPCLAERKLRSRSRRR